MGGKRHRRRKLIQETNRHIVEERRDISREQEMLHRIPDERMRALMAQLPNASEAEALEIMLKLQEIIRGPAALTQNPEMGEQVAKMRQAAAERDRMAKRFESDQAGFIEEVFQRAEKIKPTGERADRIKAEAAKLTKSLMADARRSDSAMKRRLDYLIDHGPKETITVLPKVETVQQGDSIVTKTVPEVIRLRHRAFALPAGTYEVPKIVAEAYRNILRSRQETEARKAILSSGKRDSEVFQQISRIDQEYGSPSVLPQVVGLT